LRDSVVLYLSRADRFAPGVTDIAALDATFGHLKTLRDVFPLALVPNPRRADPVEGAALDQEAVGAWLCPIDGGVSTNGRHPFGALRPCGHVMRLNVAHQMARRRGGAPLPRGAGGPTDGSGLAGRSSINSGGGGQSIIHSGGGGRSRIHSGGGGQSSIHSGGGQSSGMACSPRGCVPFGVPVTAQSFQSDGISSIERGEWDCPVCSAPVEVLIRLLPPADDVTKCRTALLAAQAERAARKRKKKREDVGEGENARR
jgi:hypothetical protein